MSQFDTDKVLEMLQEEGISYLWLHHSRIQGLLEHDPEVLMKQSYALLQNEILPRCGRGMYQDQKVTFIVVSVCARGGLHEEGQPFFVTKHESTVF